MRRFSARTFIRRPAEAVFDFIADYRNVPKVLDGISRWEPLGRRTSGAGARYEVEMRTFGISVGTVLKLDEWQRPRRISWVSEAGPIPQAGGWNLTPRNGGVDVELEVSYRPPGAILGNLVADRVEGLVRRRLQSALQRMRRELEREG